MSAVEFIGVFFLGFMLRQFIGDAWAVFLQGPERTAQNLAAWRRRLFHQ